MMQEVKKDQDLSRKRFSPNKPRYMTRGVNDTIPATLLILLWCLIDAMKIDEIDYLQVFTVKTTIKDNEKVIEIEHSQECPEYKATYYYDWDLFKSDYNGKLFFIDDEDHQTCLLPEEY